MIQRRKYVEKQEASLPFPGKLFVTKKKNFQLENFEGEKFYKLKSYNGNLSMNIFGLFLSFIFTLANLRHFQIYPLRPRWSLSSWTHIIHCMFQSINQNLQQLRFVFTRFDRAFFTFFHSLKSFKIESLFITKEFSISHKTLTHFSCIFFEEKFEEFSLFLKDNFYTYKFPELLFSPIEILKVNYAIVELENNLWMKFACAGYPIFEVRSSFHS